MKASKLGILSALIASICCIGPLVLILLGLGSLGVGATIGKYHWYFISGAIILITSAWRKFLKEKKTCSLKGCKMENKKITLIILLVTTFVVVTFIALNLYTYMGQNGYARRSSSIASIETKTVNIPVKGMTCFTCEASVSTALKKIDGVVTVKASAKRENTKVVYDPQKTDISKLIETINEIGYKASPPGGDNV